MIFVTVGTHEQSMDRLFQTLESAVASRLIDEPVFVQCGYTGFTFSRCEAKPLIPYPEVESRMREARIIISHGGPATIMQARIAGKIPVVVPRQHRHGEHVNDHQVDFCKRLEERQLILAVYEMEQLLPVLQNYAQLAAKLPPAGEEQSNGANPSSSRDQLCRRLTEYCRDVTRGS